MMRITGILEGTGGKKVPKTELLTEKEAGVIVDLSAKTLQKYRTHGGGPKFLKLGRKVRYRRDHLEQWLESRTYENTGQAKTPRQSSV